jgi:hypothetical protein
MCAAKELSNELLIKNKSRPKLQIPGARDAIVILSDSEGSLVFLPAPDAIIEDVRFAQHDSMEVTRLIKYWILVIRWRLDIGTS